MKVHFIAIGGSAMHNLAIALRDKGYEVSGSDDAVYEPSRTRLDNKGLLPEEMGWDPKRIHHKLDAVILGMHAKVDNPELLKAKELGVKIYSYPEYIYHQSEEKIRVVIAGSHGKTTITSMVLHVLNHLGRNFDYMVGAQLDGFDTMVKLTQESPIIVLEGDEYLSSPIDRRPKFLWYKPHVALISGIAWDHVNVFPTYENYVEQFEHFVESLSENQSTLVFNRTDSEVKRIAEAHRADVVKMPYGTPKHQIIDGVTYLVKENGEKVDLKIFGDHNLQNLNGAFRVLKALNVSDEQFFDAIQSFEGAAKRLELIAENDSTKVFKDFAHSPSKLQATCQAVKVQYSDRTLVAVMELHTFSSLTSSFLLEYKNALNAADVAVVYFNPSVVAKKNLPEITKIQVKEAFGREDVMVFTESDSLSNFLKGLEWTRKNLLLMSSGNFDGIDLDSFGKALVEK